MVILLLLLSLPAFALDAVVTVLETPVLRGKSIDADVVQNLRKGDVIKIFSDTDDEFVMTVDRMGKKAWVIKDHLYFYYEDPRELGQRTINPDPTDYRLEEPLPKKYPLYNPNGYRGQALITFSQAYNQSYDYPGNVKTKGYTNPVELNINMSWKVPYDRQDRFFFGLSLRFRTLENQYTFFDSHTSSEKFFQVGAGPMISYDVYKGTKNRISLLGSVIFNPYNFLTIAQRSDTVGDDVRHYRGWNLVPRFAIQYHRKEILENLDFVAGTSMDIEGATTYQARDGGSTPGWWKDLASDQFKTRNNYGLSAFFGIQAAY